MEKQKKNNHSAYVTTSSVYLYGSVDIFAIFIYYLTYKDKDVIFFWEDGKIGSHNNVHKKKIKLHNGTLFCRSNTRNPVSSMLY